MPRTNSKRQPRIVSLAPSATSILVALGARREIVGVTRWCKDVARVDGLPALGDCWSLDVQQVVNLRPTLVIGSVPYKPETVAKLLETPITFLAMNPRSLADIYSDIRLLGGICGRVAAATKLVKRMQASLAAIARRASLHRFRPRVYCEAWPNPRITSPPWVAELVEIAGGRMALPPGRRVTDREVARARPDIIVIAWAATGSRPSPAKTLAHPAWQDVPAIRNRRVHVVRDEFLNTPGPPLLEGARALERILRAHAAAPEKPC